MHLSDAEYDKVQIALMEETCLIVDNHDKVTGFMSKKQSHLLTEIAKGTLHRAFSIFLFNSKGELLLQQRSGAKITFANYWTNTCCSHPIVTPDNSELDEHGAAGVKRAAKRKLEHELNISLPIEAFRYITRIHYKAPSDGIWGEHEIDYVIFVKADNIDTNGFNSNEVSGTRFVSQQDLRDMMTAAQAGQLKLTPWFDLISTTLLFPWWNQLHNLQSIEDHARIHRLGSNLSL
jgi:isopentenyl-diphosphate delta-isomerase